MDTMETIYLAQTTLSDRISRAWSNFQKLKESNLTKSTCITRMDNLRNLWTQFENNHYQLLQLEEDIKKKVKYFKNSSFEKTEEKYLENLGLFQTFLDSLPSTQLNESRESMSKAPFMPRQESERLPRIDIPKFSGQYDDWENFRDLFTSLVINRPSISSVSKMLYLKNTVQGDAERLLSSFPITGDSFEEAWKKLKEKYENLDRLVESHVAAIFSIKYMREGSAGELKRVLSEFLPHLTALKQLKRPVDSWDDLLVHIMLKRLDEDTIKQWILFLRTTTDRSLPPTWTTLIGFLEGYVTTLETLEKRKLKKSTTGPSKFVKSSVAATARSHVVTRPTKCLICSGDHFFLFCEEYKAKTIKQRSDFVATNKRCFSCLGNHFAKDCTSKKRCQVKNCGGKHHSSLHDKDRVVPGTGGQTSQDSGSSAGNSQVAGNSVVNLVHFPKCVLLATAMIKVCRENGHEVMVRALIDPGAQVSFISEHLCQLLKLKRTSTNLAISGVGNSGVQSCKSGVSLLIRPRFKSEFVYELDAYVLPKITSYNTEPTSQSQNWDFLKGLTLADPDLYASRPIDVLLGAEVYSHILEEGIMRGTNGPIAIKTVLGWVLSGEFNSQSKNCMLTVCLSSVDLDKQLQRFWDQEEVEKDCTLLPEEDQVCEDFFKKTHARDESGAYIVRLPFRSELPEFPGSFQIANEMLRRMEKRFANKKFADLYLAFMDEYASSGHMRQVALEKFAHDEKCFFLPHHGVFKAHSSTPKLRTVFNGSAKARNGKSINDYLFTGANLLPDLSNLLIGWMKYAFVFVADVTQMFRCIRVHEEDQRYQLIVWRSKDNDPISAWQLQTVTYGMVSSPWLAIRVMRQLAMDEVGRYPLGAEILQKELYMDDTLSGAHDLKSAMEKQSELIGICKVGGFPLHKWMANHVKLLESLDSKLLAAENGVEFSDPSYSVLGLSWKPTSDGFHYAFKIEKNELHWSKRKVLSRIAQLFDPLGWLSPIIITGKLFMRELWLLKVSWDEELPREFVLRWLEWYQELEHINELSIPRWLGYVPEAVKYELHGFGDASGQAYGAVVFLRTITQDGATTHILQAKSRVAPVKTITIPKLELCAAVLLCRLVSKLRPALNLKDLDICLWTDSTDVLFWLKEQPLKWPMYIANRCSQIHRLVPDAHWFHVSSENNSADVCSRGLGPSDLKSFDLWWHGPRWLQDSAQPFDGSCGLAINHIIRDNLVALNVAHEPKLRFQVWELLEKYSDVRRLFRITAYALRFIDSLAKKRSLRTGITKRPEKLASFSWYALDVPFEEILSPVEIQRSKYLWTYLVQRTYFKKDIIDLELHNSLPKQSNLKKLDPFLKNGLLRLGGRLQNSSLDYDNKHPLILPSDCIFSDLLVREAHFKTLHGGSQLTLATLRQNFWITNAKITVKRMIRSCPTCIRYRGTTAYQKMANLPAERVTPSKPFAHTGVDYAGPFQILCSRGRGQKSYKGYICLFICLSTKAVHLELCSTYASQEFIAAFRRFTARRGHCFSLHSDQGTTFVGADGELKDLYSKSSRHVNDIKQSLVNNGTKWIFNPPAAPHFGGIWESSVKSVKHHLLRTIGDKRLTYEEFSTVLSQIEAYLNSRPLMPLTDDPSDLNVLTPARLLIGSDSYLVPETDYCNENIPVGRRWECLQQLVQRWWRVWSEEYLQTLQKRYRWPDSQPPLTVGDIVLIKSENNAAACWPLARILEVFPGKDNLVRVVKLKTCTGQLLRPVHKLVPLLLNN